MNTSKMIAGTIAGLAVGATLGILFAPEKGSVTRKKIMDTGKDYADGLKTKYSHFKDTVKDQFQSVEEDVNKFTEAAKSKLPNV